MKKLNKYIMLFVAALALVSCVDDGIDNPTLKAEAGDEVQFGLTLPSTRTVYGDEETVIVDGKETKAFPIYWVNNDKVFIFSPQCLDGHRGAEYAVSVDGAEQNYATSLTKTGASGVQWGDNETADFYSLYPSGQYGLSDDGKIAKGIVVNTSQNIVVTQNADGTNNIKSDMEDCLLYAKKTGVQSGATVELQYSPITTVFMLTLGVGGTSTEEYTIQSISLTAPEGTDIAGKFGINVADGTFAEWGDTKDNIVSAAISDKNTGGYLTLTKGQDIEVPLFIAPIRSNVENGAFSVDGWTIEVKANNKSYYKTLGDLTVVPGQIHKIALPKLSADKKEEWDVATWMKNIPRNVYLSEISIPGAWDAINGERQNITTISGQYAEGVRAFHFDTRWRTSDKSATLGYLDNDINGLSIAGASSSAKLSWVSGNNRAVDGNAESFEDYLDKVVANLSKDEYMVVVCTFAQDSYDYSGTNGKWYGEISAICAKEKYDYTIYDAKNLTKDTVVGDVLNRVIVIVNMPEAITESTALPSNSKCLFTYMPMMLEKKHFDGTDDNQDKFWLATTGNAKDSGISVYNNQAQVTSNNANNAYDTGTSNRGYAPTMTQRTNVLNNILSWSKANYSKSDYAHDMWIYLGLGGYQVSNTSASQVSGSSSTIASTFNTWINNKVKEMGTVPEGQTDVVPYYPVGIVLMNYVTDYAKGDTVEAVKNILLLNNKYRLQYDPTKSEDYINPNLTNPGTGGDGENEEGM